MTSRVRLLPGLLFAALVAGEAAAQVVPGNVVVVTPFNTRPVVTFDPTKPLGAPAGGANNLPGPPVDDAGNALVEPGLDAVTTCEVVADINGNTVTVTGVATIYVPTGNDAKLLQHERAHVFLCRREYNDSAESKFTLATQPFMTFGSTLTEAAERALAAVRQQMGVISDKFDLLTGHGRSPTVGTARGVRETLREREEARRQSAFRVPPGLPDTYRVWGGTADPPWLQFDPVTFRVSLGGDVLITDANDMTDPIIGRGAFELDPMALIGPDSNGTIHLADTGFRIRDTQTGQLLLNGFLLDVAYLDSAVDGYKGVIQAMLDVPPDWAGGTSNFLGSPFIAGMAEGSAAGDPSAFWFFTEQRLFERGGANEVVGQAMPVIGNMKAGFMAFSLVPEPSSISLLMAALLGWGCAARGRWLRSLPRLFPSCIAARC